MTHSTAASLRTHSPRLAVSLAASLLLACLSNHPASPPPPDSARAAAFLDTLEERTFHYFWDLTNPQNGLTPDRAPSPSFSSIAAVGFALTAYPIGVERGYITRAQAVASTAWAAWVGGYHWGTFHGQDYVQFGPLFGHEYSHVWIDFRGIQDAYMRGRGIDYFENSRRATYAQRAYAAANPGVWNGYSNQIWGLTASDGPANTTLVLNGRTRQFHTYWARGVSSLETNDDGTLAPTAAGGAVPFTPEISIPALITMRETYGSHLFSTYGFRDAFNPTFTAQVPVERGEVDPVFGWFDVDYLGIDQGPILAMIENYRSELIWRTMRNNSYIVRGLKRAGFTGGWVGVTGPGH